MFCEKKIDYLKEMDHLNQVPKKWVPTDLLILKEHIISLYKRIKELTIFKYKYFKNSLLISINELKKALIELDEKGYVFVDDYDEDYY